MLGRLQVAVFFSLYRAGRLLDHKVSWILGQHICATSWQVRGNIKSPRRARKGCGAKRPSLSVPMHVWSSDESTTRRHAKSSARGAMRRALGHEDRLLRSALTGGCSDVFSWFGCPSGPAFNWSGLRSHRDYPRLSFLRIVSKPPKEAGIHGRF